MESPVCFPRSGVCIPAVAFPPPPRGAPAALRSPGRRPRRRGDPAHPQGPALLAPPPPRPPIGGPVCQSTSGLSGRERRLRSPLGASIARQPPGSESGRRPAAAASDRRTGRGSAPISSTRPPWRRGGAARGSGSGNDLAIPPQVGPGPGGTGRGGGRGRPGRARPRRPSAQPWVGRFGASHPRGGRSGAPLPGAGRGTGCRVWGGRRGRGSLLSEELRPRAEAASDPPRQSRRVPGKRKRVLRAGMRCGGVGCPGSGWGRALAPTSAGVPFSVSPPSP